MVGSSLLQRPVTVTGAVLGGGEWPHPGINWSNGEVKDLAASDRPDREEGASPGCSSLHAAYVCVPVELACWEGFSAKV